MKIEIIIENNITYEVVSSRGTKIYYFQGMKHREGDLPAVEHADGLSWYHHNQLRRIAGPAIICGKICRWFYYGQKVPEVQSQEEFERWLKLRAF